MEKQVLYDGIQKKDNLLEFYGFLIFLIFQKSFSASSTMTRIHSENGVSLFTLLIHKCMMSKE